LIGEVLLMSEITIHCHQDVKSARGAAEQLAVLDAGPA
jgi:hypothetical protein